MSPGKLQNRAEPLQSLRTPDSEEHAHDRRKIPCRGHHQMPLRHAGKSAEPSASRAACIADVSEGSLDQFTPSARQQFPASTLRASWSRIGDLLFRASPVELPQFIVRWIIEACLLGELLRVVLPAFAGVLADDRLHRGVGLDRGRVDAQGLAPKQFLSSRHAENELKDLVEHLFRQPLVGLADRRMVGHVIRKKMPGGIDGRPITPA